jgi:ribosome-associated protein
VEFAFEKKAKKPVVLDVSRVSSLCNYFVICSADNNMQVKAIYDGILQKCEENNLTVHHHEEDSAYRWLLIDLFDVIVHIFLDEARGFYDLEHLWGDAKRVRFIKKKR